MCDLVVSHVFVECSVEWKGPARPDRRSYYVVTMLWRCHRPTVVSHSLWKARWFVIVGFNVARLSTKDAGNRSNPSVFMQNGYLYLIHLSFLRYLYSYSLYTATWQWLCTLKQLKKIILSFIIPGLHVLTRRYFRHHTIRITNGLITAISIIIC